MHRMRVNIIQMLCRLLYFELYTEQPNYDTFDLFLQLLYSRIEFCLQCIGHYSLVVLCC